LQKIFKNHLIYSDSKTVNRFRSVFEAADGNYYYGDNRHKYKSHQAIHMNGDMNDQSCCSFIYSKIFGINKCCCAWLDKNELFSASHKKGIFIFIFKIAY